MNNLYNSINLQTTQISPKTFLLDSEQTQIPICNFDDKKCECCVEQISTKKGKFWIIFNNCIYVLQIMQIIAFWTIVAYGINKPNKCL